MKNAPHVLIRFCWVWLTAAVSYISGCTQSPAPPTEPPPPTTPVAEAPAQATSVASPIAAELLDAIRKGDSFELYSLQPGVRKDEKLPRYDFRFHDWPLLGKIAITHPQSRAEILTALESMFAPPEGGGAPCFTPRHGLRVVHDGTVLEVVICFECHWAKFYRGEELVDTLGINGAQPTFDQILKQYNVTLPNPREKFYDPTEAPAAPPETLLETLPPLDVKIP